MCIRMKRSPVSTLGLIAFGLVTSVRAGAQDVVEDPSKSVAPHESPATAPAVEPPAPAEDGAPLWLAPSLDGSVGLLRMHSARTGPPLRLRVGMHGQGFSQQGLVVRGAGTLAGDDNSRTIGDLTFGLTGPDLPWLRNLEIFASIASSSNLNERTDRVRTDPTLILSLGNVTAGLAATFAQGRGLYAGVAARARFLSARGGMVSDTNATSGSLDFIGTYDVANSQVVRWPILLHLNAGYMHDRSLALLPDNQCANSTGADSCIRSRVVETFAYGLGTSRVRASVGVEWPIPLHSSWGALGIVPFGEYHLEASVGDGDPVVTRALGSASSAGAPSVDNVFAQFVTAGVRAHLADRCSVLAAVDVGIQGTGFAYGPPMPAWNAIAGFSYTFERDEAHALVPSTPAPEAPPPAVAAIEAPPPEVPVAPVAALTVPARVSVSAFDADGTAVSGFTTALASADGTLKGTPRADGGFEAAAGVYVLHVEANGFVSRDREVRLENGETHAVEVLLRSEAPPSVKLTSSAIELGEPIVFGHKDAQILPRSREILAIVIDVLAKHPEIRTLSIEGHTDDVGPAKKNFELSSARALAVRAYLGAHGVDASRLRSMGYGESKPLVPNRSASSRAKNRRVEFRIVE